MYTYEIKHPASQQTQSSSISRARQEKPSNGTPNDDTKKEVFDRHFLRFWGNVGDQVVFKRPKRAKIRWTVLKIEKDIDKITWTNGGWTPNYIQVTADIKDRYGVAKSHTCWTCENKLLNVGPTRKP